MTECDHLWQLVKEEDDSIRVVTDLRRHGMFKATRNRLFGLLTENSFSFVQEVRRSTWWTKGWHRQWACSKCRKVLWEYIENEKPKPEVKRDEIKAENQFGLLKGE